MDRSRGTRGFALSSRSRVNATAPAAHFDNKENRARANSQLDAGMLFNKPIVNYNRPKSVLIDLTLDEDDDVQMGATTPPSQSTKYASSSSTLINAVPPKPLHLGERRDDAADDDDEIMVDLTQRFAHLKSPTTASTSSRFPPNATNPGNTSQISPQKPRQPSPLRASFKPVSPYKPHHQEYQGHNPRQSAQQYQHQQPQAQRPTVEYNSHQEVPVPTIPSSTTTTKTTHQVHQQQGQQKPTVQQVNQRQPQAQHTMQRGAEPPSRPSASAMGQQQNQQRANQAQQQQTGHPSSQQQLSRPHSQSQHQHSQQPQQHKQQQPSQPKPQPQTQPQQQQQQPKPRLLPHQRFVIDASNPMPIFAATTAKKDVPKTSLQEIKALSSMAASTSTTITTTTNGKNNNNASSSSNIPVVESCADVAAITERLYKQLQITGTQQHQTTTNTTSSDATKQSAESSSLVTKAKVDDDQPKELLVNLLPYQKEALRWMLNIEHNSLCGGILADDMGLGKTIQILSLVAAHRLAASPASSVEAPVAIKGRKKTDGASSSSTGGGGIQQQANRRRKATLVVCTLSTLHQWQEEITSRFRKGTFSVATYYSNKRESNPSVLQEYDIVLTTYGTVAAEFKDNGHIGCLGKVLWRRIVLDEAHTIKNKSTKSAKAMYSLDATYRWCLTGTPIQNSLDDLYSLLHFLRVPHFATVDWWKQSIYKPVNSGKPAAVEKGFMRLQAVLAGVLLRRTKDQMIDGKPILCLPKKVIDIKYVEFPQEEREVYDALWKNAKKTFNHFVNEGSITNRYMVILELLLRLRQACDHLQLCGFKRNKDTNASDSIVEDKASSKRLAICGLCSEVSAVVVSTVCGHQFCKECFEEFTEERGNMCPDPTCMKKLRQGDAVISNSSSEDDEPTMTSNQADNSVDLWAGPKIDALIKALKDVREHHPDDKVVVFSQFTSFLNIIQVHLQEENMQYTRLDGTMSQKQRCAALSLFKYDEDINVMLVSLKAGGTGLNLVEANRLFLLDPWWNPATEQQAIDRVYRLGQKKQVMVSRVIMKNSIEEKILMLQEKKLALAAGALQNDKQAISKLTIGDLKLLFSD